MTPFSRVSLGAAASSGALAVVFGAFGAHALRDAFDERAMSTWHTAVDYQFWHALALLACSALAQLRESMALRCATLAFVAGSLLFCGSLYALALGAPRWIGAVTPLGGAALILGWLSLAVHARRV